MAKLAGALLCLLLSACSDEPASPPPGREAEPASKPAAGPKADAAPSAPIPSGKAINTEDADDAAKVVQAYYSLIEARDYGEAYSLREAPPGAPSLQDFKANFERYAEFRVTIGTPSTPVESDNWLYVEVPVQPYGRLKDGSPVASAGMLTLRKRKEGGAWRIFTKA